MTCEQRRDLLLLYVSDALEASEAGEVRRHLQAGCPRCEGYLAEAQAMMSSLPLGLDAMVPPAHLKQKLMQRIDADVAWSASSPANNVESGSNPMRLFRYLVPTAVAAGLAVAVTHSFMMHRVTEIQHQADAWRQESNAALIEAQGLEQLRGQFQSQTQVVEMLQSPGLKLIPLKATEHQPNAVANLLWDQKKQQWAILTTGMLPAAAGQTYELWFVTQAGDKIAAGTFDVDEKGEGSLKVSIPPNIGGLKLAAVTNEKAGGATQPTGNFQVMGSVE